MASFLTLQEASGMKSWAAVAWYARVIRRFREHAHLQTPFADLSDVDAAIDLLGRMAATGGGDIGGSRTDITQMSNLIVQIAKRCDPNLTDHMVFRQFGNMVNPGFDACLYADTPAASGGEIYKGLASIGNLGPKVWIPMQKAAMVDYDLMRMLAEAEDWSDSTPVSQELFGPLWPDRRPPELPAETDSRDEYLQIELDVADASNDDVIAIVRDLVGQLDELHRAYGGHGLTVESLEAYTDVPLPAEVRR